MEEGKFKDGKEDGMWTYWYPNGIKKIEGEHNKIMLREPIGAIGVIGRVIWKHWNKIEVKGRNRT
jgi:antitoxin component YwqK of YwqJK toxin-antitoxin module